ncbi:MAG: hypothetical protein JST84_03375 [Acidobacteria bacterium]|nr:hypothetical protein [Acidobacteriota bacterium]
MAKNENNLDPNFDALLKSHVKKQGAINLVICDQFDPDTANAYLERAMTKNALASFESHLSDCPTCRRQVIELSRMMPVSPAIPAPISAEKAASLMERVRDWFTGWSIGALAGFGAVVATVLLIATIAYRPAHETQVVTSLPQSSATPVFPESGTAGDISPITRSVEMRAKSNSSATPAAAVGTPAPQAEAAGQAPLVASQTAPAEKSNDDRKEITVGQIRQMDELNRSQNQMRNFRELAPSGPAVNQAQPERGAPATAAPIVSAAPPPPPKSSEKAAERMRAADTSGVADAQSKKSETKQSASEEAPKSAKEKNATGTALAMRKPERPFPITRTIGSKVFLFENGIWTDTTYEAGKALPLIRLRQDSEEYKQILKEVPSLKPFFDLNPVIVVWQEKVYRVEKK